MNKKFDDIFSRVDTVHQRVRQTVGQTDGHRATAKTALRITSRGKNGLLFSDTQGALGECKPPPNLLNPRLRYCRL